MAVPYPSGPFMPWIRHTVTDNGLCEACRQIFAPNQRCETDPALAYTHYDMILTHEPIGNIVPCVPTNPHMVL